MNEHNQQLLNEFKENVPTLNAIKDFVLPYLRKIVCEDNKIFVSSIEGRVKTYESLKGKLDVKGYKYNSVFDLTDLFGARIVTFYTDEVDFIATLIEKNFDIDYENSIDKRKMYDVDRFGYMSLHYICKIPKSLYTDPKNPNINEFRFEVQMRTSLQHTWATIFHDTGYKSDVEVPKEYIRRLSRLEGLLEIADDEFKNVRDELENYRRKIRSLVSKGDFKDISLNIDSYRNYLALDPFRGLINKIASITNAEVEESNFERFFMAFVELGFKTLAEVEQMRLENSEDAYKLSLVQLGGTDIDIISSTVAIQNLLIIYVLKKGGNRKDIKEMLEKMSSHTKTYSDAYIDKVIEQSKGIIKI